MFSQVYGLQFDRRINPIRPLQLLRLEQVDDLLLGSAVLVLFNAANFSFGLI